MKVLKRLPKRFYRWWLIILYQSYYTDLKDMPIGNFMDCLAGDLSKVSKRPYFRASKLDKYWGPLFNQHLELHGLSENYKKYLAKMIKALQYYDKAYKGKKWLIIKARVAEAEAEALLKVETESIENTCAKISKFMGFPVQSHSCTVIEFYSYVKLIQE